MPARRFATPLFCGIIALASAEFSGNALAQAPSSDGVRARDLCGATSCEWTGLIDVRSSGSLSVDPFGGADGFSFLPDDDSDNSKGGAAADASHRGRVEIAAGLGIVGAAALVATTTSGSSHGARPVSATSGPAIGEPIGAVTVTDAVTATPEPATIVLIATGLLVLIPISRVIRSR